MSERLSPARRVGYALGMTGYEITDTIVVAIAVYFYLPPPGRGLEPQVSEDVFWGVLTAFGLAMLVGRIVDALSDLVVGYLSDRSRARAGRRRAFLIRGLGPMVAVPVLLFWPPGEPGSTANALALAILLCVYFAAFTAYVAPYLALLPELARTAEERVGLSTLLALLSFPTVALFAAVWPWGLELARSWGLSAQGAVRAVVVVSSGLALILCIAPILAVDESRHVRAQPSALPLREAVRHTLRNGPFLVFLAAQIFLILGVNLVRPALVYYATVVLGRDEGYAAVLGGALFAGSLAGFWLVHRLARAGLRMAMVACTILFSGAVACLGLMRPDVPGGPEDARNVWIALTTMAVVGVPVAGFLVLPNVLISQLVDRDEARTGEQRAAMYFGMQGLALKWVYGVSGAALAFLFSRYGKSPEQPLGVLLVGPIAGVCCLVSGLLFLVYPERRVLREIRSLSDPAASETPAASGPSSW